MREESTIKPPASLKFKIEELENRKCNVHMYDNIAEKINEEGDVIYTYDLYILKDIPYHENLKANIKSKKAAWLAMAKAAEEAEPKYSDIQRLEQDITDQMLENIEQGQYITELELLILGGN